MNKSKKEVIIFGLIIILVTLIYILPFIIFNLFGLIPDNTYAGHYLNAHDNIFGWFVIFIFTAPALLQLNALIFIGIWLVKRCQNPYLKKLVSTWEIPVLTLLLSFLIDYNVNFLLGDGYKDLYILLSTFTKSFIIIFITVLITKALQRRQNE